MASLACAAAMRSSTKFGRAERRKYIGDNELDSASFPIRTRFSGAMSIMSTRSFPMRTWRIMVLLDDGIPKIAQNFYYKIFMTCVIIASCAFVGIGVDAEKYNLKWDDPFFKVTESLFLILFIVEYFLNFFSFGKKYALTLWGGLDLIIILTGIASLWIYSVVVLVNRDASASVVMSVANAFAAFRILRLFQLARAVRLLTRFKLLWSLVRGMVSAIGALTWTFFLMVVVFYLFALLGVELIGKNEYLRNHPDVSELVEIKWGSVLQSMLTTLQITTLDSWNSSLASPLTTAAADDPRGPWLVVAIAIYFIALVAMGALVLMNLVTAVIVEQSMEGTKQDLQAMAAWERKKVQLLAEGLRAAFEIADKDNDGELSWEELEALYLDQDSTLHPFLTKLGDLKNIREMFVMMDLDGSGSLEIDEFVDGIQRCKDDFNKFMMWQLWKKQNTLIERLDDMAKSPSLRKVRRNLSRGDSKFPEEKIGAEHTEMEKPATVIDVPKPQDVAL